MQRTKAVDSRMEVRLLGHLEVEVSGELVRFEGAKQRRLFAMLALRPPTRSRRRVGGGALGR